MSESPRSITALASSRVGTQVATGRKAYVPVVRRQTIRRGALTALLRPIGMACALVVVGVPAISIWNIYSASEARRIAHETTIKTSGTHVDTPILRQLDDEQTEFVFRLQNGKLVKVLAGKTDTLAFLQSTSDFLEAAREEAHRSMRADLDRVFEEAFASRQQDIEAYADWFFAWGRSWRFLYEAGTGAVQEMARLFFSRTQVTDAARQAAEDYLMRNYAEIVLKPATRDGAIAEAIRLALQEAHRQYLTTVAALDERVARFLAEKTNHLEELPGAAIGVTIDWDAEKWKAPFYRAEDRFLEPIGTVGMVGGSAFLGRLIERAVTPILARAAAQLVATTELTVGGAAAGSVSPGLGTAIGALAGIGLDWAMSAFRAHMERDDFVRENAAALEATITAWKARLEPQLIKPVDVWYDDTVAAFRTIALAFEDD